MQLISLNIRTAHRSVGPDRIATDGSPFDIGMAVANTALNRNTMPKRHAWALEGEHA